jgi:hypothetical protein
MINKDFIMPSLGGRLGNNLFMIANAYARALDQNRQLIVPANQVGHMGDFVDNVFRKLDLYIDHPSEVNHDEATVYGGYFQSENHFEKYSEAVKSLFSPTREFIDRIRTEIPVIFDTEVTVINVRRGDYLYYPTYHPIVSPEYIFKALHLVPSKQYIIASDDIPWCKEHLNLSNAIYLEGWKVHEQLWIMAMCHHFIISNSSFSWWAAYLSRHPGKTVIAPETWFGPEGPSSWEDMYCKEWTILPTYFDNGLIQPK